MMQNPAFLLIASLLATLPVNADGLYPKSSSVLQVDHRNYDQLIANSNHTSIVEFYAPWCGHCQNLKPAYEKAAKNLEGLAKVAAVNCDDDANKPFCGRMGVQGFPTLKIVTPSKKPGKPRVEDYKGARSAKAIVDAVVEHIPNHVKRLSDKDVDAWLSEDKDTPKAILFTEKGTTSALLKSVAIDFLGSIKVGQIRSKETESVEKFGITSYPTLILLRGGDREHVVYDGELKKKPIVEFLSQAAAPNPDPAPVKAKAKSSKSSKKSKKPTKVNDEAEKLKPTESPDPQVVPDDATESKPVNVPVQPRPLDILSTPETLESACLTPKSSTCVLALLPSPDEPDAELPAPAQEALVSLSTISHKLSQGRGKSFPFYNVPAINSGSKTLRESLGLPGDDKSIEIIALNGRRGWWRRYDAGENGQYGLHEIEAWVDAIRLGEGSKEKLPEGVIVQQKEEEAEHDEL
ncbi:hypothetical protein Plec18167_002266 [Paecilomyces lecythidis]|uniref:protein disulfide-isomerase n=1 Tax=Paecilomyces lecythidis TaxID=3004212 RepID=A0ABR3YB49_9EURO